MFPPAARLWSLVWVAVGESQPLDALLPSFGQVRAFLLVAGQGEAILLTGRQDGVRVGLQTRPLVVWESHGEKRLRVAYKLVDIPFPSHLQDESEEREMNDVNWTVKTDHLTISMQISILVILFTQTINIQILTCNMTMFF